ncbi:shikimate dehydrogenase family protein [Xanthomarina sp. F2636L]|uniref:shikimate dehydrogenase family protein n=1 Tax=Xanthomarina sp. F2636L TaxID=2996018 RepID=UPI00225E0D36|nr:shikimate dehydrogenase [Xanthomarina sp. F2636L]MCX7549999.1 shikimate dehydrogenase [Xanthomarina sp. F2636L]
MNKFGLIGKNISYSFSREYFKKKFKDEDIMNTSYENFDLQNINEFPEVINKNPTLKGLNVTIPYKESVIPYLDKLNKKAKKIRAVNTIKISKKGKLTGYNTDYFGFKKSLEPHLKSHHKKALILGTGGASKAIAYALKKLNIEIAFVSRTPSKQTNFSYTLLTENDIRNYQIIINCTPLGTHPHMDDCPEIPYQAITDKHILFDLIYNPEETKFLRFGKAKNATTINGYQMLIYQADKAWRIWSS